MTVFNWPEALGHFQGFPSSRETPLQAAGILTLVQNKICLLAASKHDTESKLVLKK